MTALRMASRKKILEYVDEIDDLLIDVESMLMEVRQEVRRPLNPGVSGEGDS